LQQFTDIDNIRGGTSAEESGHILNFVSGIQAKCKVVLEKTEGLSNEVRERYGDITVINDTSRALSEYLHRSK